MRHALLGTVATRLSGRDPARVTLALAILIAATLVTASRSFAGLDLTWNACNQEAAGRGDLTFDCADTNRVATLYGNFQLPTAIPDFFAMDAVLDIEVNGAGVPPFWHFETGGCNGDGLTIHNDRPAAACPAAGNANPWGANGSAADAFITAYGVGFGGANRARLLLTIARAAGDPTPLDGGQNYYGFDLGLPAERGNVCAGCASPAGIAWSTASFYGTGGTTTVVTGAGLRSNVVSINGGTIDTGPAISIADTKVVEGNSGTTTATFTVSLSTSLAVPVTVDYQTSDGTATLADADYSEAHGTLTIPAQSTSAVVTVSVRGDSVPEPDETFYVDLSNASIRIERGRGTATISNDDRGRENAISIGDASLFEGNTGLSILNFPVTIAARNAQTVRVDFVTVDNSADNSDYRPQFGTLVFAPGQSSRTIQIAVIGDAQVEGDEIMFVELSNPSNGFIVRGQGVGTILDDDRDYGAALIGDATGVEGNAGTRVFRFPVTLVPANTTTSVDYETFDGTATVADGDYLPQSGTLTFAPHATSDTIRVTVVGDTRIEDHETFFVRLIHPNRMVLLDSLATGLILDDDKPMITVAPAAIDEGNAGLTPMIVTVTLSFPISLPVDVDWFTYDLTATVADNDYVPASGHLTFPPGSTVQTVTVQVKGDLFAEDDETFAVVLSRPENGIPSPGIGFPTIRNDDGVPGVPEISIDDVTAIEGDSGARGFVFTVTLSHRIEQYVTVDVQTADGTATVADHDYAGLSFNLSIPPNALSTIFQVGVNGDDQYENDETFTVDLSNPTHATIADGHGVGTITNDDHVPTLFIGNVLVVQGNSDVSALFTVTLTNPTDRPVTMDYQTADGTATVAGGDYVESHGAFEVPPGQRSAQIAVPVLASGHYEPDEWFFVDVSNVVNATVFESRGMARISSDYGLSIVDVTAAEGNTGLKQLAFAVRLSNPSNVPVTVGYQTHDGSATIADNDYQAASGVLTIAPGMSADTIRVGVVGDAVPELDETFGVELASATNAVIDDGAAVGTIVDDDRPVIDVVPATIDEGNAGLTPLIVSVTLSFPPSFPVDVDWHTEDQSATVANDDYVAASGHLTFPPGSSVQTLTVQVKGDLVPEDDDTFAVVLSNPVNAIFFAPGHGIQTIRNDDGGPEISIDDVTGYQYPYPSIVTPFVFQVHLNHGSSAAVSVHYSTLDGTATAVDGDYTPTSGTLVFGEHTTEALITVMVLGGNESETETFQVQLTSPLNATIADAFGLGTIRSDVNTPTLVSQFRAEPSLEGITLRWQLVAPERVQRIDLERADDTGGPWSAVSAERRNEDQATRVIDPLVKAGSTYFYRLVATTNDGERETFGPISVRVADAITAFALSPIVPNPGTGPFRFEYALPLAGPVRVTVADLQGRVVAVIAEGPRPPGRYQAAWSGRGDRNPLPAGLYFVRFQAGGRSITRRIALAR